MLNKIKNSLKKFDLNLQDLNVLTEAASGNYVITPIIAALAGANVTAITKDSAYATVDEVKKQTMALAKECNVEDKITILSNKRDLDYGVFDIVTNTGFVRPIDKSVIEQLSEHCVIPLMWEPWEYRADEIDLEACIRKGIKVYGTDESDIRLKTMSYIGYIILFFLLKNHYTPFSANILIIGNDHFVNPTIDILNNNKYNVERYIDYDQRLDVSKYNVIILLENQDKRLLIGDSPDALIQKEDISSAQYVLHICGNVDFDRAKFLHDPDKPKPFGYMSYTTDFIDNNAVIDLHTAGLKVAEGMLKANKMKISGKEYKKFMLDFYPALAFDEERCW